MKLTILQAKIIDLLTIQQDIRFSNIAKTLKISQPLLSHHLNTLEKNNIIQRFKIVLNQNQEEQTYHTLLKLKGSKEQFLKDMHQTKPIFKRTIQTFGEYDFFIAKKMNSPSHYQTLLQDLYKKTNTIQSHHTLIETSGAIYNTQLSKSMKRTKIEYYDVPFPDKSKDQLRISIIQTLKENALISQIQLAQHLKISYPTLRTHLQDLHKKNIILGKRIKINFEKLGLAQYYLFLQVNPAGIPSLYSFAEHTPNIIRLSQYIGEYNIAFEIISPNETETEQVITNLKQLLNTNLHSLKMLHKTRDINLD